ncbi:MAG: alanine racemase [Longimicrobiales bacterium]
MSQTRRAFLATSAAAAAAAAVPGSLPAAASTRASSRHRAVPRVAYDPWLEIDADALLHNARELGRRAGGRPILAVLKNNAYGLGIERVGPILERAPEVEGFAVVKPEEAVALRDAGVRKPVLLMALVTPADGVELARRDIRLAPFTDDAPALLGEVARRLGRPVPVHLYIDTGMSRMGMPYHRALPWIEALAGRADVRIEGTFMGFTEDDAFDAEQLGRFRSLADSARAKGLALGRLHAASSHALFLRGDEVLLDMVRPGLALYGAYPGPVEAARATLRPALRLRAKVVRVERLRPGDGVSYGRHYIAERPTWVATLPVGHVDGNPRGAVDGSEVLIGGRLYPVIGAVSASHTIIELGDEKTVEIGDVATLVGPDDPAIHPNTVAERSGASVYDVLMHLSARLPGQVVMS